LAAKDGDEVVGWAALSGVSARRVYSGVAEVSCYVSPNQAHRGIGASLIGEITRLSEQNGIWTLEAKIIKGNDNSIGLFKKSGFRLVGYREKLGYDRNGIWRDIILMERRSGSDKFGNL
jgi:phosphinothricin acetyltransferase